MSEEEQVGTAPLVAAAAGLADDLAQRPVDGVPAAAADRVRRLRDQLDGHVLPRLRTLDAPLLVLLLGPTGAGKSSLLNTLAGARVSPAGVIRPTTRDLVVVANPADEAALLAVGAPLRTLAPGRLRLVTDPAAPAGVALVDSPDLDSVEHANRELTERLAEAADLAIFVTTATRYADRIPWEALGRARDRGLPLLVVVNRMPADEADRLAVLDDLARLLEARGVHPDGGLAAIAEGATDPSRDALDAAPVALIRDRIEELGRSRDARRALAERALRGTLAGLGPGVERAADDLEHEAIDAAALHRTIDAAFDTALRELLEGIAGGAFLRAEAVRQWQQFVGADQVTRLFATGIGRVRGTIAALVRGTPPAPVAEVREDALADLVALARERVGEAARRSAAALAEAPGGSAAVAARPDLWGADPAFERDLRTRLEAWVDSIGDEVRQQGGGRRTLARGASVGVNATGVAVMLATFSHTGGLTGAELGIAAATAFLNQKLLEALFGEAALVEMIARARTRLTAALTSAFHVEAARYRAQIPDDASLRDLAARLRSRARELGALQRTSPA